MRNVFTQIVNISLCFLLLCSCKENESKQGKYIYKPKTIKRFHTVMMGHEIEGYTHYVMVENYNDDDFNNFLVDYADEYRRACKVDLPVWAIIFCKPFNFDVTDEENWGKSIQENAIVGINYSEETLHKDYPDIESVTFYADGKSTYIQLMTVERRNNAGYSDSSGKYRREWIKDFNKKFNKNYRDTFPN